jgi:hypothetical protein
VLKVHSTSTGMYIAANVKAVEPKEANSKHVLPARVKAK